MKTKKIALIFCAVLLCISTALYAKSNLAEGRPRIGVLLDRTPLPDLLVKHLRLEPGQGIRISNVQQNSPADKAGLERDDIIIGFQDEKIKSSEQLIDAVQEAGVGAAVSLEIIHLGERKTIELRLETFKDNTDLKYLSEPEIFQTWRPGRMFRFRPGDKDWMEMELPFDRKSHEVYEYYYSDDGEDCSITIEGDPEDENTKITVSIGNDEYKTTVSEIDKLPEKFRIVAEDTLKKSKKHSGQRKKIVSRKFSLPSMVKPDELSNYLKNIDALNKILKERGMIILRRHDPNDLLKDMEDYFLRRQPDLPQFGPDDKMFDKIQEQMRKLQERIEELEKHYKETPEPSSAKPDSEKI